MREELRKPFANFICVFVMALGHVLPLSFMVNHQLPSAVSASPHVQGPHMQVAGTTGEAPQTEHLPVQSGSVSGSCVGLDFFSDFFFLLIDCLFSKLLVIYFRLARGFVSHDVFAAALGERWRVRGVAGGVAR